MDKNTKQKFAPKYYKKCSNCIHGSFRKKENEYDTVKDVQVEDAIMIHISSIALDLLINCIEDKIENQNNNIFIRW